MLQHSSMRTCPADQCLFLRALPQLKSASRHSRRRTAPSAFLSQIADNISDPILRRALKEPVAFWGGFTAGALALNLKEDPLRSWIERTAADAKAEKSLREVSGMPASQRDSSQEELRGSYGPTPTYGTNNGPSNRARWS